MKWKHAGVMMECGHSANGEDCNGNPVCVMCIGIVRGATIVCQNPPSLDGREAICCYGDHGRVQSSTELAFFESRPEEEFDRYYCGCHGWD